MVLERSGMSRGRRRVSRTRILRGSEDARPRPALLVVSSLSRSSKPTPTAELPSPWTGSPHRARSDLGVVGSSEHYHGADGYISFPHSF